MIAPAAFRMAGRRLATTGSRRVFSATAVNTVKNDHTRMALMVTAGLSLAVATLQQKEVGIIAVDRVKTVRDDDGSHVYSLFYLFPMM